MKAVKATSFGGPGRLELVDAPDPTPEPGEIRVRVQYAAVNFADVNRRRGTYAEPGAQFPLSLGLEVFGQVDGLGPEVTGWSLGDAVAGFTLTGSYAELAIVPQQLAYHVPSTLDSQQAAAFPVAGQTAYHLLTSTARAQPEDRLLVTGAAGGVGLCLIQIARLLGCGQIVAAAGTQKRMQTTLDAGAHAALNSRNGDLAAKAMRITGDHGADLVFDAVGGEVRTAALHALAPFGKLVQYGNASAAPERLPSARWLRTANVGIVGFHLATLRNRLPHLLQDSASTLTRWLSEGSIRFPIAEVLPLDQAQRAHELLESRAVEGKVLLEP